MDKKTSRHLRVLFFGTTSQFSLPPLEALLNVGIDVRGVVVPAQSAHPQALKPDIAELYPPTLYSSLPIINSFINQTVVQLAWQRGIPVYEVHRLHAAKTHEQLAALQADVGCVACFPRRLPPTLLSLLPNGWLNIHPSLLPAYRGPAPLFWIMRDGIEAAGVTIHRMDADFDTGDIAAQATVVLPDGVNGVTADKILAQRGGELLLDVISSLADGILPSAQKQTGRSIPAPWPTTADFQLRLDWSARRAFNFMRGTSEWHQPYTISAESKHITLSHATSYTANEVLPTLFVELDNHIRIQFATGVLDARPT